MGSLAENSFLLVPNYRFVVCLVRIFFFLQVGWWLVTVKMVAVWIW